MNGAGHVPASYWNGQWSHWTLPLKDSLLLAGGAVLTSLLIAQPVGIAAGMRPGGAVDPISLGVSIFKEARCPDAVSGGERQRIALARALAARHASATRR